MIRRYAPGLLGLVFCCAFSEAGAADAARANPLLEPSPLPLGAPAFDRITTADFAPAFAAAMRAHLDELEAIATDPTAPTFENTLVALERAGWPLRGINLVFGALTSADTNPELQAVQQVIAPRLAAHRDALLLDGRLFARVEAVHERWAALDLDPESAHLLEYWHRAFVRAGARLPDADKERLRKLNEQEADLSTRFAIRLLEATKQGALVVDDAAALAGLSPSETEAAAAAATARGLEGRWLLSLQNTTQQPRLASLTNRTTRETLFMAAWNRACRGDTNDTRALVTDLAGLRARKAGLLGYPSYAAWVLEDQMARTPEAVDAFLAKLGAPAVANARAEAGAIQQLIDTQGGGFALAPWDWDFHAEQVRRAKYELDGAALEPYFELGRVLHDGVFFAAARLYGLEFRERHDLPVYHPDMRVYDVIDHDGSQLALFYTDLFARENKNGGAWMDNFVVQSGLFGTKPVIYNVCNFRKPAAGQPALLSLDEVTTLFHEFGHALHGMFASQRYPSLSGTYVARDFVELPSQINEHWALHPEVFGNFARHHATGEPMPANLAERIRTSTTFNQGYALTELLAAARLDLAWHGLPATAAPPAVDAFEAASLSRAGLDLPEVPTRYRSSYFRHIFGGEYAAGYYAYLWAEMLDNDAYAWFTENGGLTRAGGDRFRALILSRGNTADYGQMFREFRGRDPVIEPMLAHRGIGVR
ncbi:MAG: M3 family metallopeptidase [bacterium]|nr:M3 family metallopeptidase [bacterium]